MALSRARLRALRALRSGRLGEVVVRPAAAQLVATLKGGPWDDVGELFYRLEVRIRDLHARASGPPFATIPDGTDGLAVAVPLTAPIPAGHGIEVLRTARIPRMACTLYTGKYSGLQARTGDLLRWLRSMDLRPTGTMRAVYLRFLAEPELRLPLAHLAKTPAELVTELQVPVAAGR